MNHLDPAPGSVEELARFAALQKRLLPLFRDVYADRLAPRTVVVVPGLTLDRDLLGRIAGLPHYEERMLTMLMLLRLPNTRIVFISSSPIAGAIVDYYLGLLPGVPHEHAKRRLVTLSPYDASPETLTRKILERPRLLRRIREAMGEPAIAHLSCFTATELERTLAVQLGIPLYGCDPALLPLGSKSGGREIFREAGVLHAPGFENIRDEEQVIDALTRLKQQLPALDRAVLKLNDGVAGEGNACFDYAKIRQDEDLRLAIGRALPRALTFEAVGLRWPAFKAKLGTMGGIVETWIAGTPKRSPSVQMRVNALGRLEAISTHDQLLGGRSSQTFLGSTFPADPAYRLDIQHDGLAVGEVLRRKGVMGRFAVDFVSVPAERGWRHYAIEINLRKGGTTHTFQTLQFLTGGRYEAATGLFLTPTGQPRYYLATDNLQKDSYRRFTPEDLIEVLVEHDLHFDQTIHEGVSFNLIGALPGYGKLSLVCIAGSPEGAQQLYSDTVAVLDREAERD